MWYHIAAVGHKCTRVARSQERVEVVSMIDLVLVKKDTLYYVQDVRTVFKK